MDAPPLAPVVPGRPALAAFGPVEAWIRERAEEARAAAARRVAEARAEADRIRGEGEARLRKVLGEGERESLREAEDRARDRVSGARGDLHRWIMAAEADFPEAIREAVARLAADRAPE